MNLRNIFIQSSLFAGLIFSGDIYSQYNTIQNNVNQDNILPKSNSSEINDRALHGIQWLTTKVYIEGNPEKDVKDQYTPVIGFSLWDINTNRYEFFSTDTGLSRGDGARGYFFNTGNKKFNILVPKVGNILVRRLEKLTTNEFTYSREVPSGFIPGNPIVKIYVVHTPYYGPIKVKFTED